MRSPFRFITSVLQLLAVIAGAQGRLTSFPWDSVVLKEKPTVFSCCSDVQKTIFWKHKPVGSPDTKDINDLNGLVNGYETSRRFNATPSNSPGCYSLIIKDVTLGDEGLYSCTDNAGLGQWKGWELLIIDTLDCQETNGKAEYMGVNDFGLRQDVISTMCISKCFGNLPLQLICEWSSGTKVHDSYYRLTHTVSTTTLSIQMPATKEFNGDQLSCYVKIDGESNDNRAQTAWKSSHLIINYASFSQTRVRSCSADELSLDCQPSCNFTAQRYGNGTSFCEITYLRKGHHKAYAYVPLPDDMTGTDLPGTTNPTVASETALSGTTITIIVVSVAAAGILGIVSMGFLILWKIGRRSTTATENETLPSARRCISNDLTKDGNTENDSTTLIFIQ